MRFERPVDTSSTSYSSYTGVSPAKSVPTKEHDSAFYISTNGKKYHTHLRNGKLCGCLTTSPTTLVLGYATPHVEVSGCGLCKPRRRDADDDTDDQQIKADLLSQFESPPTHLNLSQDPNDIDPKLKVTAIPASPCVPAVVSTQHGTVIKSAVPMTKSDHLILLICCAALVAAASVVVGGAIGPVEVRCATMLVIETTPAMVARYEYNGATAASLHNEVWISSYSKSLSDSYWRWQ